MQEDEALGINNHISNFVCTVSQLRKNKEKEGRKNKKGKKAKEEEGRNKQKR